MHCLIHAQRFAVHRLGVCGLLHIAQDTRQVVEHLGDAGVVGGAPGEDGELGGPAGDDDGAEAREEGVERLEELLVEVTG